METNDLDLLVETIENARRAMTRLLPLPPAAGADSEQALRFAAVDLRGVELAFGQIESLFEMTIMESRARLEAYSREVGNFAGSIGLKFQESAQLTLDDLLHREEVSVTEIRFAIAKVLSAINPETAKKIVDTISLLVTDERLQKQDIEQWKGLLREIGAGEGFRVYTDEVARLAAIEAKLDGTNYEAPHGL